MLSVTQTGPFDSLSCSYRHTKTLPGNLLYVLLFRLFSWRLCVQCVCVTVGGALSHARSMLWSLAVWLPPLSLSLSHTRSLPLFPSSFLPPSLSEPLHHVGYKELRGAEDQSVSPTWELMQDCVATQQAINQPTGKY